MARLSAFPIYGGKYFYLKWLLPLLPPTFLYCEPCGGSAGVLLNRESSTIEIFNDIDEGIINFFRVLREQGKELIQLLELTPYSRQEYIEAISKTNPLSDLERARKFFVIARQVTFGLVQKATPGRWGSSKNVARKGMAKPVAAWLSNIENLPAIIERLKVVQIENLSACEVIRKYDQENALFYLDPPYPIQSTKVPGAYRFQMTDEDHIRLAKVLNETEGKVAISGQHCSLLDDLYDDWFNQDAPIRSSTTRHPRARNIPKKRIETLWANYNLSELGGNENGG